MPELETPRAPLPGAGTAAPRVSSPARGADVLALLALLIAGLVLGVASLVRRPDLTRSSAFLFGDQSLNLLATDRLLAGERLYAQVAYPYGPIPAHGYALFARLVGNGVLAFDAFLLGISLLNLGLAYLVMRRYATTWGALLVAVLGLTPVLLVPGSLVGAYAVSPYVPMERTALLVVCLLWTAPARRSGWSAAGLGLALGLWQGVRFGGAFFAGTAVLLLDALSLYLGSATRPELVRWVRALLATLAAFLVVQGAWVAYALLRLPAAVARDFLWPSFVLKTYGAWVQPGERWPRWGGWSQLLGQQLTPLLGAALGVAAVALLLRAQRRGREDAMLPLLLPLVFYAVASAFYFRQVYHFYQFAWALVIPATWATRARPRWTPALVALLLPCFALNAKAALFNPADPNQRPVRLPNGETVWAEPSLVADLNAVVRGLGGQPALFLPLGGGVHHFYGIPSEVRQPWFLPGFIRPYDEADLLRALPRQRALVVLRLPGQNSDGADPCTLMGHGNPFPPHVCTALRGRLDPPVPVGESFVLFPVRN